MKTIWLIRHAESSANAGFASATPKSTPITERGRQQSELLAQSFCEKPDLIITSAYIRTKQTAEPTIQRFSQVAQEEWPVEEYTYLEPSRYSNTTMAERKPFVEEYWKRGDPFYQDGHGAETFAQFIERVQNVLGLLQTRQETNIFVFTHGYFIRAVVWTLLQTSKAVDAKAMNSFHLFFESIELPNTGIILCHSVSQTFFFGGISVSHLNRIVTG